MKRNAKLVLGTLVLVLMLSMTFWMSCETQKAPNQPEADAGMTVLSKENPKIQAVMAIQERYTEDLMKHPDVVGTATGLTEDGRPAIWVLTKTEIAPAPLQKGVSQKEMITKGMIPDMIEGTPVVIMETGVIRPMKVRPPAGPSHTAIQTPPIQLGVSGGWRYDLANGYCCGGTLGSLITFGGKKYILSNYHVLMADIVSGGNNRVATVGDPVIQPGLIDVGCNAANAQDVATLAGSHTLPNANIDAAIAQIISGMVSDEILEIGMLSSSTVAASIGQAVKKSGRTTGLTRSSVSALNATVSVAYENECAGESAFTKTFTGQIVIANKRSKFLNSGDSGSLMVEDVDTNPRAVGLLFAGGTTTAIANPINEVLSYYGATMVGN